MAEAPFAEWLIQLAPSWLRRPLGGGWLYAHGLVLDGQAEAARQAVLARFLAEAPLDAVPYLADERQLPQPAGADLLGWRTHLADAWTLWRQAGTRTGMVQAFATAGLTAQVYSNRDWPLPEDRWSDYRIVVTGHPWQDDGVWDDPGTWDDGGTWDSTASEADVATTLAIVRLWAPAEGWCRGVLIVFSGDPTDEMAGGEFTTWLPKD